MTSSVYTPPAYDANGHRYDPRVVTPPGNRGDYHHSSECPQSGHQPRWELVDIQSRTWRRYCGGHPSCSTVEYDSPQAPAPPRPDVNELAEFGAEHGRRHTEVVCEVAPGDTWPSWVTRCTSCRETKWWRGQAATHYARYNVALTNRAPIRATMTDFLKPEDKPEPKPSPLAAAPSGKDAGDVVAEADAARRTRR